MAFLAASSFDALFAPWTPPGSPGIAFGVVQHGLWVDAHGGADSPAFFPRRRPGGWLFCLDGTGEVAFF